MNEHNRLSILQKHQVETLVCHFGNRKTQIRKRITCYCQWICRRELTGLSVHVLNCFNMWYCFYILCEWPYLRREYLHSYLQLSPAFCYVLAWLHWPSGCTDRNGQRDILGLISWSALHCFIEHLLFGGSATCAILTTIDLLKKKSKWITYYNI